MHTTHRTLALACLTSSLLARLAFAGELTEESKMTMGSVEYALKQCPADRNPATEGDADRAEDRLKSCDGQAKTARRGLDGIAAKDKGHERVVAAAKKLTELERNLPQWRAQWEHDVAAKDQQRMDAFKARQAFKATTTGEFELVVELVQKGGDAAVVAKRMQFAKPADAKQLAERTTTFVAAMAECDGAWKSLAEARELCALVPTAKASIAKAITVAFDKARERKVSTMHDWATALKTSGEAYDDVLAAIQDPAAWVKAEYEPWKAPFETLGVAGPASFEDDLKATTEGVTLAGLAKQSRFTAKHHDAASEGAAKTAVVQRGHKVLRTGAAFPSWDVKSDGGRPTSRNRDIQVLAQKAGEPFCRVYVLSAVQRYNDVTGGYDPVVAEIAEGRPFLISSCK